jgi:hypothetical protein
VYLSSLVCQVSSIEFGYFQTFWIVASIYFGTFSSHSPVFVNQMFTIFDLTLTMCLIRIHRQKKIIWRWRRCLWALLYGIWMQGQRFHCWLSVTYCFHVLFQFILLFATYSELSGIMKTHYEVVVIKHHTQWWINIIVICIKTDRSPEYWMIISPFWALLSFRNCVLYM